MELKVTSGAIAAIETGAIILGIFEGITSPEGDLAEVDRALDGAITLLIRQGEIKGKLNEITLVHTFGRLLAPRVVVVGLGKAEQLNGEKVRGAVAEVCKFLRQKGAAEIATVLMGVEKGQITAESSAQLITEGALLGLYSFDKHKAKEPNHKEIRQLAIVSADPSVLPAVDTGMARGQLLAESVTLARDMVNEPANMMTPAIMAETASRVAGECGIAVEIFEREQMKEMGMGALLGVAQGSQNPPRFIVLRYQGKGEGPPDVALVGKGITFDSGGISIKPSEGMGEMKGDMAGGASVLGAISAIARLKLMANVVAIIPATENLPDGNAFRPGDILKAITGKTIEVISTDAEGRLILADALGFAVKLEAKAIVDVATLTGACRIALGDICTGAFANNQTLVEKVIAAGNEAGELIWQMPMFEGYKEQNKSGVADIKNTGGRYAGAITAAQFLGEFVGETPWVHLDIAGTSMTDKDRTYRVKGATGVPVRTLVNLVMSLAK